MGIVDWLNEAWKKHTWIVGICVLALLVAVWWALNNTDITTWLGQNWVMLALLGIVLYIIYSWKQTGVALKQDLGLVLKDLCEHSELFQRKGILYREIDRGSIGGDMEGDVAIVWFDFPGTISRVWAKAQFVGGKWLSTAFDDGLISAQERRKHLHVEPSVEELEESIKRKEVVKKAMDEAE
ncbi:MAG: hypothetical protein WC350_05980 [Candidatus Micrarchaeia archaeon]|jgi:hypothetical protein